MLNIKSFDRGVQHPATGVINESEWFGIPVLLDSHIICTKDQI